MDIGGSNGGSAALPTLKGCIREIRLFLNQSNNRKATERVKKAQDT